MDADLREQGCGDGLLEPTPTRADLDDDRAAGGGGARANAAAQVPAGARRSAPTGGLRGAGGAAERARRLRQRRLRRRVSLVGYLALRGHDCERCAQARARGLRRP